jgi:SAM-dependent methyltransferase
VADRPASDSATIAALARLYDVDLIEDPGDLELYLALASRTGGPVVELAAGSGRLAVPLAAAGHRVTAVDVEPAMLARAAAAAARAGAAAVERLELVEADLVGFRPSAAGRYRLAILALNSLLLLGTRAAQEAALRTMAVLLVPGGLAVVDVWQPDAEDLSRFDGRLMLEYVRTDPESGLDIAKTAAAWHDAPTGAVVLTSIYDEGRPGDPPRRWTRTDRLRLVRSDELVAFAEAAGLAVETLAGDHDLTPIGPGSDRAILVAVRPSGA